MVLSSFAAYFYLVSAFAAYLLRIPSLKLNAQAQKPEERMSQKQRVQQEGPLLSILMISWFIASIILPVCYVFWKGLSKFDFRLPAATYFIGALFFIFGLWILRTAHTDLARSWSAVVQIKRGQQLVTEGIYASIRHPIYSAHLLWGATQILLIHNWLCGVLGCAMIFSIIALRIPREEKMLLSQYGEDYREYMRRTGALYPRLR